MLLACVQTWTLLLGLAAACIGVTGCHSRQAIKRSLLPSGIAFATANRL